MASVGVLITFFIPKLLKEDIKKNILIKKGVSITIMISGLYLLNK